MNRGLEKNNEGERLTKQETKKSEEISDAFRIWQREATSEDLEAKPPASNGFLVFLQKNTHISQVFLSKKNTTVSEILATRIGIHNNARAKGGAMAPYCPPCVLLYSPFIFLIQKIE